MRLSRTELESVLDEEAQAFQAQPQGFCSALFASALDPPSQLVLAELVHRRLAQQLLDGSSRLFCDFVLQGVDWFGQGDGDNQLLLGSLLKKMLMVRPQLAQVVFQMLLAQLCQGASAELFPSPSRTLNESLHRLTIELLDSFPFSSKALLSAVEEMFPYRTRSSIVHTTFVNFVLRLTLSKPVVRPVLLSTIFQKVLALDAEVHSSQLLHQQQGQLPSKVLSMVAMLVQYTVYCTTGQGDFEGARPDPMVFLRDMLRIFLTKVLVVRECYFVPLVYFRLCSLNEVCLQHVLSLLLRVCLREQKSTNQSILASMYYINSILKHSLNIPPKIVAFTFDVLSGKLLDQLRARPDLRIDSQFSLKRLSKTVGKEVTLLRLLLNIIQRYQALKLSSDSQLAQLISLAHTKARAFLMLPLQVTDSFISYLRSNQHFSSLSLAQSQVQTPLKAEWAGCQYEFPEVVQPELLQDCRFGAAGEWGEGSAARRKGDFLEQPRKRKKVCHKSVISED